MASKKKAEEEYVSKAVITTISATSRASVKIKDSYFTMEYHEERALPNGVDVDIVKERQILWDTVNAECDKQIEEAVKTFR